MLRLLVIAAIIIGVLLATGETTVDELENIAFSTGGLIAISGFIALLVIVAVFGRRT